LLKCIELLPDDETVAVSQHVPRGRDKLFQ
jgi:hypothetical protein